MEVIEKLPPPILVKNVCSFLGHIGFYKRFIKDFSKVERPMYKFLENKVNFKFGTDWIKAFEELKRKLTKAPILIALD